VATIREKRLGVWEVRVFTGADARGRPPQILDTWAPPSARDQQSRVRLIKKDQIGRLPLARLTVADVERWHTRLRAGGMADSGIKNQHECSALRCRRRCGGDGCRRMLRRSLGCARPRCTSAA